MGRSDGPPGRDDDGSTTVSHNRHAPHAFSSCSDETLREYFSQYGSLETAEVMRDRYTGKSRGFGFVTFMDSSAAMLALQASEHTIDGRRCEAKLALPKVREGKKETGDRRRE